jgi:hypothetical protein
VAVVPALPAAVVVLPCAGTFKKVRYIVKVAALTKAMVFVLSGSFALTLREIVH